MKGDERAIAVVREWVGKAENDLLAAAHVLKLGRGAPAEVVCFHAQQCAEKYLKALLAWGGRDPPKTHDLVLLASRLPNSLRSAIDTSDLAQLTPHATVSRYPGGDEVSLSNARRVLAASRRVRAKARSHLPRRAREKPGGIRPARRK